MDYLFRLAKKEDICQAFELYRQRIQWMDKAGIAQWNVTNYLEAYPKEYYEDQFIHGNFYVLEKKFQRIVVGAVVLLQADERWSDKADDAAYYIHNLVTSKEEPGAGKILLNAIEMLAIERGKSFVRLDCAVDNAFLNRYYETEGYVLSGECSEGTYYGYRREKRISLTKEG